MPTQKRPVRHLAAALLGALLSLAACDAVVEPEPCVGYPDVEYEIADISLVAGAEVFSRDLTVHPRVFRHTRGVRLTYAAESSDRRVAEAYVDDGWLTVEAMRPGDARITVEASDACDAYATVEFWVEVLPYAAQSKRN